MVAYGYRLFKLDALVGRSQNRVPLEDLEDAGVKGKARKEMHRHLDSLVSTLLFGPSTYLNESPVAQGGDVNVTNVAKQYPYVRVRSVKRDGNTIKASVEYGREGDYELLVSQDGSEDVRMLRKAAVRTFRIWFIFPKAGHDGFVVAETRGRTQVAEVLTHWLKVQNQHAAATFNGEGERSEGPWVRWRVASVFGDDRIDSVLKEGHDHAVTLKRRRVDPASNRVSKDLILTKQGLPMSKREALRGIIRNWWEQRKGGISDDKRQEAAESLWTVMDEPGGADTLQFNDGEISFTEQGKTQTISPSTIERLFVYPLGNDRPSDAKLLGAARKTLGPIARDLKVEVDLS